MDSPNSNHHAPSLIYHDGYDLNFGDHVFPTQKFRLIRARLIETGLASPADFHAPQPASRDDVLRVHTEEWVTKLERGTLTYQDIRKLEVPYSRQMVMAYFLAAGGTTLAGRHALQRGVAMNLGGGFHHAFPAHGEGFCAVNDVAVAIRRLQADGVIDKATVVDCDVHHGNGTAAIFHGDPTVFTLSIHQYANYPTEKPPSTLDIHLEDGTRDRDYLDQLSTGLQLAVGGFHPGIVFFVAGSDPFYDDQLGGLSLTREGMFARDRMVFDSALKLRIPVAAVLAGGYARKLDDTVDLHANTARAARESLAEFPYRTG